MSFEDYIELIKIINEHHRSIHISHNDFIKVKYIECSLDTRDNSVYLVVIKPWFYGNSVMFNDKSLDYILKWLRKEIKHNGLDRKSLL